MPRMSTDERSLTADGLNEGEVYTIAFSCRVDEQNGAMISGTFRDKFSGFSLGTDRKLYTVWEAQDAVWVHDITFIRPARHRD